MQRGCLGSWRRWPESCKFDRRRPAAQDFCRFPCSRFAEAERRQVTNAGLICKDVSSACDDARPAARLEPGRHHHRRPAPHARGARSQGTSFRFSRAQRSSVQRRPVVRRRPRLDVPDVLRRPREPFYWFTYAMIWILPAAGVWLSIRDRDRPLLDTSLVLALRRSRRTNRISVSHAKRGIRSCSACC